MDTQTFSPKFTPRVDALSRGLFATARLLIILMIGLLPLFFIPGPTVIVTSTKIFFVILFLLMIIVVSSLGILRNGAISISFSSVNIAWWAVVAAAFVSAILSPTPYYSLVGINLSIQTVGFLAILGLVMTVPVLFVEKKAGLVYIYSALIASAIILAIYQIVRIFASQNFLSFGFLQGHTATVVGSFNDLGIFLAFAIIISIITLIQLPLLRNHVIILNIGILLMLAVLCVINFFVIWVVLALFSLSLLMYSLTKDRMRETIVTSDSEPAKPISLSLMGLIFCVFVVSSVFLIGGSLLGDYISNQTGVNYIEVRPTLVATLDVMRHVYHDNAFTGIGPNQFYNAWNLYKNPSLNQTIFWGTPFTSGSGYIPTWFVTTGIFGVLTWSIFLLLFLYTGFKTLTQGQTSDRFWYYIGTISFVAALFVWGLATVYVPGPTILILGAFSTGVMLLACRSLLPGEQKTVNLFTSMRARFVMIVFVMVVIIGAVAVGYGVIRQFAGYYTYATLSQIPADNNHLTNVASRLVKAYNFYPSALYAHDLATYQFANMQRLLAVSKPTEAQKKDFQNSITNAIQAANEAIRQNPTNAANWLVSGDIYAALAAVKIEGAANKAHNAYDAARKLDPQNPYYDFAEAVMAYQTGDATTSRTKAMNALQLKPNYTDALFLVSQLDIDTGDLKKAITTTQSLVSLDAYNPGRYYQLGVLESANDDELAAIRAFSQAIVLNPKYANALYLRAQQYLIAGDTAKSLADLGQVRDLNPDNEIITTIINKIKTGNTDPALFNTVTPVTEPTPTVDGNRVTTDENSDTDLVTPVSGSPDDTNTLPSPTVTVSAATTSSATTTKP